MTHVTTLAFGVLILLVFLMFIFILALSLARRARGEGDVKIDLRIPEHEYPEKYGWEELLVPKASARKKPRAFRSFFKKVLSVLVILAGISIIITAAVMLLNSAGDIMGFLEPLRGAPEGVQEPGYEEQVNETLQNQTGLAGLVQEPFGYDFIASGITYVYMAVTAVAAFFIVMLAVWYVRRRKKLVSKAGAAADKIIKENEKKRKKDGGGFSFRQYLVPLTIFLITLVFVGTLLFFSRNRIAAFFGMG